ncbi:hypothetical protein B0H16DRAFT_833666 [Mycena metata]|uniref:Uncharacterized protein n=1 Tax=Mycena metata TaxID=1033252 RepID=A0AAD7N8L2_9AGAR|nr:hypothetical protein B0H16DRAFT_833666 [Mycena metata]
MAIPEDDPENFRLASFLSSGLLASSACRYTRCRVEITTALKFAPPSCQWRPQSSSFACPPRPNPASSSRSGPPPVGDPERHTTMRRAPHTHPRAHTGTCTRPRASPPAGASAPDECGRWGGCGAALSPRARSPRAHSLHAPRHRRSATFPTSPTQWLPSPLLPAPPAPVYMQMTMQVLPGAGGSPQFAFVHPQGRGREGGYASYAYSTGSPIAMPAPVQTV